MKAAKLSFAASRAHVWLKCGASEAAQRVGKNKFGPRSPESDEGTLIHARAARALDADVAETSAEFQLFANPESDAQAVVDFYVDAVMRSTGAKVRRYVEHNFSVETKAATYSVIPDTVLYDHETNALTIFDLKTGFVSVAAEDNEQLLIGAHAAARHLKVTPSRIVGVIVQPRMSVLEYAEYRFDAEFFDRLDAQMKARADRFTPGAHCKNCGALTTCKTFRTTLDKYLDPSIKDGLTSRVDEWQRTLAISSPARKFFETLESEAKDFLELGGVIPGFGLAKSGGKRQWFRELPPTDIAKALDLKPDDLFEQPKLSTVAAVEKRITKDKRAQLASLVYQPQNKSLVVTDNKSFLAREGEKIIRFNTVLQINNEGKKEKKNENNNNKSKTGSKAVKKSTGNKKRGS